MTLDQRTFMEIGEIVSAGKALQIAGDCLDNVHAIEIPFKDRLELNKMIQNIRGIHRRILDEALKVQAPSNESK